MMNHALQLSTGNVVRWPLGEGPLVVAGMLCLAAVLPTLFLLMVDQRILDDEALWLKPLKFQISMAVMCLTIAAAISLLPKDTQIGPWIKVPAWSVSITAIYELIFLAVQAGRGKRSHFNSETLFDQVGGSLMAVGATVLVGGAMFVGLVLVISWALKGAAALEDPLLFSVGIGLLLGGFLGGYTGSFIGMNAGPFVGEYVASDPVLPIFGWSLNIGDLRIAHFLGLHAMQILPLVTLAIMWVMTPLPSILVTLAMAAVWVWLTLHALVQAQAGTPPFFL